MSDMWQRTKRLINAYLDDLIERVHGPDKDVRAVTRAELARLSEMEVQTRASAKLFEKELAEVNLKITGAAERERLMRDRGDDAAADSAIREMKSLASQREVLTQQLSEANAAADKAKSLRGERKDEGEQLANETHLTTMRENLSALGTPFSSTDPAGTIEEMRARIGSVPTRDLAVENADRELERARAQASVEDMLARYKQGLDSPPTPPVTTSAPEDKTNSTPTESQNESRSSGEKTLGRNEGPVRPID
jgi:phage shock protein A